MIFDLTVYDFPRATASMRDGHHVAVSSKSATQAVLDYIVEAGDYERYSVKHDRYKAITEISVLTDAFIIKAYHTALYDWEIHIYFDDVDECFTYTIQGDPNE